MPDGSRKPSPSTVTFPDDFRTGFLKNRKIASLANHSPALNRIQKGQGAIGTLFAGFQNCLVGCQKGVFLDIPGPSRMDAMSDPVADNSLLENRREQTLHAGILRQAAGYIELGELLLGPDAVVAPHSARLLERALALLAKLPEPLKARGEPRILRAEALRALGRFAEALEPFRGAAFEEPQRVEAWMGLGWCLKRLDRLPDAIGALQAGVSACPRQPILSYNLACYCSLAGQVSAAIEHLAKAIAKDDRFRALTIIERDFDPIRRDPRFVAVTSPTV